MKRTPALLLLTLLFGVCHLPAYCQKNGDDLKGIISKLKTFNKTHYIEKAYLHFDKPYYDSGDTMYFKAYVTIGEQHQLTGLSGVLHVDLINTHNKIDQSIKLQLVNGVAWGDFALQDSLPSGNYRVRAYTQWMRNGDEGYLFYKTIPIGSVKQFNTAHKDSLKTKKPLSETTDVQFFPEGGNLVTDVYSKIAFKAVGPNGLGVNINGVIVDNENFEAAKFSSSHLGMGGFNIGPVEGRTYRAKVTYPDGSEKIIDLPAHKPNGITLSVSEDSLDMIFLQVRADHLYYEENKGKRFVVLIYSGGSATTAAGKLESGGLIFKLPQSRLKTGVAKASLFTETGEPLCERLFFVQNPDLNLEISSDKPSYAKREKVHITLNSLNNEGLASSGNFSVAVTDETKVPIDENDETTILTNLLLTSELKGYVEQPNYYFLNNGNVKSDLDLLMLTQGFRRFEWKKLLNNEYPPFTWPAEKALEISGTAKSLLGKALSKASVTLLSTQTNQFSNTVTDEKGNFRFSNLVFADTTKFILQAANAKGSNKTELFYNNDRPGPDIIPSASVKQADNTAMFSYLQNSKNQQADLVKYGPKNARALKEVKIKGIKEDNNYETQSLAGASNADQVWHRSDIHGGGTLSSQLEGTLRGVHFLGRKNKVPYLGNTMGEPMLVVIDGGIMPKGYSIDNIILSNVETIEVLKYASSSIYGMQGASGVLVITTRKGTGLEAKDIASVGILPITARGYYKAREFYSPKYESPVNNRPDLRSTVYWKPELVTDKDGNASFDFYNADGSGTYRMVIEGIDEKGNLGRQLYRYRVE